MHTYRFFSLFLILLALLTGPALGQQVGIPVPGSIPSYNTVYSPISLPFNPGRLKGFSSDLIWHHYRAFYATEVRLFNQYSRDKKSLTPQKRWQWYQDVLTLTNSMALHELYFHNLAGSGVPDGASARLLQTHFGSEAAWRTEVSQMAASVAGESAWIVLIYHWESAQAHLYALSYPAQQALGGFPLMALDLAPHAYEKDYGTDRARYVETFLNQLNWAYVNQRLATVGLR